MYRHIPYVASYIPIYLSSITTEGSAAYAFNMRNTYVCRYVCKPPGLLALIIILPFEKWVTGMKDSFTERMEVKDRTKKYSKSSIHTILNSSNIPMHMA